MCLGGVGFRSANGRGGAVLVANSTRLGTCRGSLSRRTLGDEGSVRVLAFGFLPLRASGKQHGHPKVAFYACPELPGGDGGGFHVAKGKRAQAGIQRLHDQALVGAACPAVGLAKEEAFACWHSAVAQGAMAGQVGLAFLLRQACEGRDDVQAGARRDPQNLPNLFAI